MGWNAAIKRPVFELGLKAFLNGAGALEVGGAAHRSSRAPRRQHHFHAADHRSSDTRKAARWAPGVCFASQFDTPGKANGHHPGRSCEAGASGLFVNHSEIPTALTQLARSIHRARKLGLVSRARADSPNEAAAVACLGPDKVMAESAALIGGSNAVSTATARFIVAAVAAVRNNPAIPVLSGAGIGSAEDAARPNLRWRRWTGFTIGGCRPVILLPCFEEMVAGERHVVQMYGKADKRNSDQSRAGKP